MDYGLFLFVEKRDDLFLGADEPRRLRTVPVEKPYDQPLLVDRWVRQSDAVKIVSVEPPKPLDDTFRPPPKFGPATITAKEVFEKADVLVCERSQHRVIGANNARLTRSGEHP